MPFFIDTSLSEMATPGLWARKNGGKLHFCIDYSELIQMKVNDTHALPLMDECIHTLEGAQ